jgi:thymidylate synthase (FAD)
VEGFVRLDAALANDLDVVNAARVSLGNRSELEDGVLAQRDVGLIGFLMRNRHGTPFEHNLFRFHISCPIFVAREWMRHRIGSFNEMSARYTKLEPNFFIPDSVYTQVGKPGSYSFEPMDEYDAGWAQQIMLGAYEAAWDAYEAMLDAGIAKELARAVLPVGIATEFYWSVNARSLMNFLSLRCAATAQAAIRQYALQVRDHFEAQMPHTYAAWIDNDMVAP